MKAFRLNMTVTNDYGMLNRVTSLFSKRGFMINSLNMKVAENPAFAYMEIVSFGDDKTREQTVKQVAKLYDVVDLKVEANFA